MNSLSSKRVWWWAIFSLSHQDKFFDKCEKDREREREKGRVWGFCKVACIYSTSILLIYSVRAKEFIRN